MKEVAEKIKACPDLIVELAEDVDVICEACLHNRGGRCQKEVLSEERVKRQDRRVLEILKLKPGVSIKSKALFSLLKKEALKINLEELCSGCQWFELGYCQEGLARLT